MCSTTNSSRTTPTGLKSLRLRCDRLTGTKSSNNAAFRETQIEEAARIFIESERTIFCWAMGLTQHKNAVANIQEIVNLMLLRGQIGKPGAGLMSGARSQQRAGRSHDGNLGAADRCVSRQLGASLILNRRAIMGYDTVKAIQAMHDGSAQGFFRAGRKLSFRDAGHRIHG